MITLSEHKSCFLQHSLAICLHRSVSCSSLPLKEMLYGQPALRPFRVDFVERNRMYPEGGRAVLQETGIMLSEGIILVIFRSSGVGENICKMFSGSAVIL